MGSTPCGAIYRIFLLPKSIKVMTKSRFPTRDDLKNQALFAASKEKSHLNLTLCALSF